MPNQRFSAYKYLLAKSNLRGFHSQKVWPIEVPSAGHISVVPFESIAPHTAIKGLYDVENFPPTEHAAERLRHINVSHRLMKAVMKLAPKETPPIPSTADELMEAIYHPLFQKVWPHVPCEPEVLKTSQDLLAELAVAGPFADYVQRAPDTKMASAAGSRKLSGEHYCIDLAFMEKYSVKKGLQPVGGTALFRLDGKQLATRGIELSVPASTFVRPSDPEWPSAQRRFLAGLNEHLTTVRHNVYIHLAYVTPMTVAATNELPPDHPVRRLLHPCFQTALIGNRELGQFQIRGDNAFSARIFSHDHYQTVAMINECLQDFSPGMMDPEADAHRRGVLPPSFDYPHLEMVLEYWGLTLGAVREYLSVFYESDERVRSDAAIRQWWHTFHELLPAGDSSHAAFMEEPALDAVARTCAAFIHTSTVTHDVVNNMVWDYCTMNHVIPTMVPEDSTPQPQLPSFELLLTLIGTWKPFNMLLEGTPFRTTDPRAQDIMDGYLADLGRMQERLSNEPPRPHQVYPEKLNYSVSN